MGTAVPSRLLRARLGAQGLLALIASSGPTCCFDGRLKACSCLDEWPGVIEALLVLTAVIALGAAGLVLPLLPAAGLVSAGIFCASLGLLLGVPTGFWYHVKLHACLRRRGPLAPGWWLRPVVLHEQLGPADRPAVLLWFYLGGAGFMLSVLGCGLVIFGVLLEGFRAGVF